MINQPCPHAVPRLFLQVGLFLLLAVFASCSATHKIKQSHLQAETKVDKSTSLASTTTSVVTTEKADTMVATKADTAKVQLYIPSFIEEDSLSNAEDTVTLVQEVESTTQKITITAKPIVINGRRRGVTITATAIKKQEDIPVKFDKTITANTQAQTQIKNDISESKKVVDTSKEVVKKKFNVTWIIMLVLLAIFIYLVYRKFKS